VHQTPFDAEHPRQADTPMLRVRHQEIEVVAMPSLLPRIQREVSLGFSASRKRPIIGDKNGPISAPKLLQAKILGRAYRNCRGVVFTTRDVHDLTGHETAWRTIARLPKTEWSAGLMQRIYNFPSFTTLLGMPTGTAPDPIARTIASDHDGIHPTGRTRFLVTMNLYSPNSSTQNRSRDRKISR